jgi:hypothetical protein
VFIAPASSGDFSRAFGDDDIISKNSETINNPAIPAPIIMSFSFSSFFFLRPVLQILVHASCHDFLDVQRVSLLRGHLHCIVHSPRITFHVMRRMYITMPCDW